MPATGGSITEVTFNGRPYSVDAEADLGKKLQNKENEAKANGNGTLRIIQKNVPQMLDGLVLAIDNSLGDLEFLSDLNDSGELFDLTVADADGSIWAGKGQITGEFKAQSQDATAEVTVHATGLKRQ